MVGVISFVNPVITGKLAFTIISIGIILWAPLLIWVIRRSKEERRFQKELMDCVDLAVKDVRGKMHDYNNHLQILYVLLCHKDHKEAREYLEDLVEETNVTAEVLCSCIPTLNALLLYKINYAKTHGIEVATHINTDLKRFKFPVAEILRVLANIVDNAIESLCRKGGKRQLEIVINEDESNYIFKVANNGPPISEELQARVFQPNFSTNGKGRGMGLYISKRIIKKYGGEIILKSHKEETEFTIILPYGSPVVSYTIGR